MPAPRLAANPKSFFKISLLRKGLSLKLPRMAILLARERESDVDPYYSHLERRSPFSSPPLPEKKPG